MSYRDLKPTFIPSADDCMEVVAELLDSPVVVTEKVEAHHPLIVSGVKAEDGSSEIVYAFRHEQPFMREQDEDDDRKIAAAHSLDWLLKRMIRLLDAGPGAVTFYGFVTVQSRYFIYDIELNGDSLGAEDCFALFAAYSLPHVPRLSRDGQTLGDLLGRRSIQEAARGRSNLFDGPRAGIVVRPAEELASPVIGRVIFQA